MVEPIAIISLAWGGACYLLFTRGRVRAGPEGLSAPRPTIEWQDILEYGFWEHGLTLRRPKSSSAWLPDDVININLPPKFHPGFELILRTYAPHARCTRGPWTGDDATTVG